MIQIANIDLSAAVIGTTGTIQIGQTNVPPTLAQQMRPSMAPASTLKIFNESGCGLNCRWQLNGQTFTIPAGQWPTLYPPANENALQYTVNYILPNAPVNKLIADLYLPGDQVYDTGALGNSPVNGGALVTNPDRIVDPVTSVGVHVTDMGAGNFVLLTPTTLNRGIDLQTVDSGNVAHDVITSDPGNVNLHIGESGITHTINEGSFGVNGKVDFINSVNTVGSFGVAPIVINQLTTGITATTLQTIATYIPLANGLYECGGLVKPANATSPQAILAQVVVTSAFGGSRTIFFQAPGNSGLTAGTVLNGTNTQNTTNNEYSLNTFTIYAASGTTISFQYRDPGGTPNDSVYFHMKQIA